MSFDYRNRPYLIVKRGEKCENDFSTVHLVLNNLEQLLNQQMIDFCNTGYDPNQTELFLNL